MTLELFARRSAVNVTAELFNDSHVLRVQCSDDPGTVECSFNDFIAALKSLRADIGTVTLKIGDHPSGDFLHRRVAGLAKFFAFPVVVDRAVERV